MNTVSNDSIDLVFRLIGNQESEQLVPVKSATCKLAKRISETQQIVFAVMRDEQGATAIAISGEVSVNDQTFTSGRLEQGDQINLDGTVYEIKQIGKYCAPGDAAVGSQMDNRFKQIEDQLDHQTENFNNINRRFDEMANQMAALLGTINSIPQTQQSQATSSDEQSSLESVGGQNEDQDSVVIGDDSAVQAESEELRDDREDLQARLDSLTSETFTTELEPKELSDVSVGESVDTGKEEVRNGQEEGQPDAEVDTSNSDASTDPSELQSSAAGNLEQLLASLNNNNADESSSQPEQQNEGPEATSSICENSITEPSDKTEDKSDESNTPDSLEESSSDLENLFATLREKDNEQSKSEDNEVESSDENSEPEVFDGQTEVEKPENELGAVFETPQRPQVDPLEEHSVTEEQQANERQLLDQLRTLQREQKAIVEEEMKCEAEQLAAHANQSAEPGLQPSTPGLEQSVSSLQDIVDEPEQTANASNANESVSELLERMNCVPSLDDASGDVPKESVQPIEAANVPEPPVSQLQDTSSATEDNGDSSDVQDYMNSLLQRLNPSGASATTAESVAPLANAEPAAPVIAELGKTELAEEPVVPLNPEEFVPKQVAPEINSNLAAMREIANASSRNALKRSEQRRKQDAANTLLFAAGGSMVAAVATTFLSNQTGDSFYWLSILFFGVTAVCSGIYAKGMILPSSAKVKPSKEKSGFQLPSFLKSLLKKSKKNPEA